jgi:hypothetical protein
MSVCQRNGKKLIVTICVDDDFIPGSDESEIDVFLHQFNCNSTITTSTLSKLMGMQIEQRHDGIFLCQSVYTVKVLERFKMREANPVTKPCDRSSGGSEDSVGSYVPYREAVGCLMYLMTGTCPDIG